MDFDLANSFKSAWLFSRKLTLDLLADLNDSELLFFPGPQLGPFWKQFRHLGRVQECYIEALTTKTIIFTPEGKSYNHGPSKKWLSEYLHNLDNSLFEILDTLDWRSNINWFGEEVNVFEHLMRMESHETLHHGQWIVYMSLMNKSFPDSWAAWGL